MRQLGIKRVADDGSNRHDGSQNDQVLGAGFHKRINNVCGDQELQTQEEVIAKNMAQLLAFLIHARPTGGRKLGTDEPDEPTEDTKHDHQDAQDADSETGMMKIFHRVFRLVGERVEALQLVEARDAGLDPFYLPFGMLYGRKVGMGISVQVDQAGRVVLPKKVRERFRLRGGDTLALEVKGDAIQLRPQRSKGRLQRVNGVLVFVSDMPLPEGRDLVAESREERIDRVIQSANEPE